MPRYVYTQWREGIRTDFRSAGRERRLTIGSHPDWSLQAARDEAKKLKGSVSV